MALIKYTVMRLALFVVSLVILGLIIGMSFIMVVSAAVISLALSYLLLRGPREELAVALSNRTRERIERHSTIGQSDADAEDAIMDAQNSDAQNSDVKNSDAKDADARNAVEARNADVKKSEKPSDS